MNLIIKIQKQHTLFFVILVFSVISRLCYLDHPPHEYFDEIYHVPAARLIADNDPRAYEWWHQPIAEVGDGVNSHDWLHPPLAKLIQAGFVKTLGDTPLAWRLPSALAGTGLVVVVYYLALAIFSQVNYSQRKKQAIALLSSFLTAVSGLVLVQSRIAMNDIFLSLWLCLSLYFILRWQPGLVILKFKNFAKTNQDLLLAGLFLGLALATKWSAIFLMAFLLFVIFYTSIKSKKFKILPLSVFSLILMPLVLYFLSYSQMFLQNKTLVDFTQLHQQIFWYQTHRQEGHTYASTPVQWFLNLRPVWYWHDGQLNQSQTANIYVLENPALHLLGLITVVYYVVKIFKNKSSLQKRSKILIFLLLAYFAMFLPWLFSPRVMFYFHYLPSIPFLAILSADFLTSEIKPRSSVLFFAVLTALLLFFALFYPHWTGLPISNNLAQRVYFAVQSWQ